MSWWEGAKEALQRGENATVSPSGNSMRPKIRSGQTVHLEPVTDTTPLSKGDIVLVRVGGRVYLHLIKATAANDRYLIGNNRGGTNGWTGRSNIWGKAFQVGD